MKSEFPSPFFFALVPFLTSGFTFSKNHVIIWLVGLPA